MGFEDKVGMIFDVLSYVIRSQQYLLLGIKVFVKDLCGLRPAFGLMVWKSAYALKNATYVYICAISS